MKLTTGCAFAVLSLALSAAPSFAQGVTQSPPSPNAGQSMPEPPNSVPEGARTLLRGSTGMEQVGTVARTRVQPADEVAVEGSPAPSGTGMSTRP